ncbi:ferrochelatase [Helicobacter mesocricetorum]|uniref:ferrochelatase n=1 Tax=Helicobacter mesocricetorum TaxID=87012 RepID=UPI000CF06A79|nr:ferrochelatase [Helicobacter mesocricetorum]
MQYKKAVVLLNMGGPNNLLEVKTFLQNMFNDPYILSIKSNFFRSILANFITHKRLQEAQSNYQEIGGKSPLVEHTFALCQALEKLDSSYFYTYAMRYTPPFAKSVVEELKAKNIKEIILFSMYPHFSYTTTQSSYDDFIKALKEFDYYPKLYFVRHYYFDEMYNQAVINRIKEALGSDDAKEFHLIFSAHSLPQRNIDKGDPYQKEIIANVETLKPMLEAMKLHFKSIKIAYQSKLGPIKWLEPNLQDILKNYKNEKLLICAIAFSIDNSETDFELSIQYKKEAEIIGIADYRVAKCLNSGEDFAKSILALVHSEICQNVESY